MYSTKKMGRNHSELTKLACLKICDRFSHIMSHFCPTALAGIVHPHFMAHIPLSRQSIKIHLFKTNIFCSTPSCLCA